MALHRFGASYEWRTRAWCIPINNDTVEPLKRLYGYTTLALWVPEDGEEAIAEHFDRYENRFKYEISGIRNQ